MDGGSLNDFYQSRMGERSRRLVMRRLHQFWPNVRGRRILGYGFAQPYLEAFLPDAERCIAAVPSGMGSIQPWPQGRSLATLVDEETLPFPDAFFDLILVAHGLEESEALRPLLRQLWRVLAPEGRLMIVAPNRASLWAQLERTPFGHGRPFSRGELDTLLRGALFTPEHWERVLYAPPVNSGLVVRSGNGWEGIGGWLFHGLGGVHVVEAGKSLYAPATPGAGAPVTARVKSPVILKPVGPE